MKWCVYYGANETQYRDIIYNFFLLLFDFFPFFSVETAFVQCLCVEFQSQHTCSYIRWWFSRCKSCESTCHFLSLLLLFFSFSILLRCAISFHFYVLKIYIHIIIFILSLSVAVPIWNISHLQTYFFVYRLLSIIFNLSI